MKIRPLLPLLLCCLATSAQEPNPFVNQPPAEAPVAAGGESFVNLTENILVPSDLLDVWLEEHPLKDDAAGLRAAVQGWIAGGKASLDHTAVTSGIAGLDCENWSILEQIYATEYEPPQPGEWPMATSFEARNLGYSTEGSAASQEGGMVLLAEIEFDRMLPHQAPHPLAEATREPDDVFIPRFQTFKMTEMPAVHPKPPVESDPFADPKPAAATRQIPRFAPGRIHLVARVDDKVSDPKIRPHATPAELEKFAEEHRAKNAGVRQVRLIFFRGAIGAVPATPQPPVTGNYQVSVRFVKVDHRAFSDWLQGEDLATVTMSAAAKVEEWKKAGRAEVIGDLAATGRAGAETEFGDYVEVSYATEWEPGRRGEKIDGKLPQPEFSSGTSFETRYTGLVAGTSMIPDPQGPMVAFLLQRVIRGGDSVHHRIFRDGKWQADIKFPVFASNRWNSHLRVNRGQWMLAGSGAAIDAAGKFDPAHTVLAFLKVE